MRASRFVACVVAKFQKLFDICVPRFEINAASAFAFSALIDSVDTGIKSFKPGNNAVTVAVGTRDKGASASYPAIG